MKRGGVRAVGAVRQDFAPWAVPLAEPSICLDNLTWRLADKVSAADLSLDIHQCAFSCLPAPPFIVSDGGCVYAAKDTYISHAWARNHASSRSNVKVPASRLALMNAKVVLASAVMRRPLIARNV